VGRAELRPLLAEALAMLGTRRVLVVHGSDGLDEVTLGGVTQVTEAVEGQSRELEWSPSDFGLQPSPREPLLVDGPPHSAAVIRDILAGTPGPPRDIVVANAAAALWTVVRAESLVQCAKLAAEAIDSGAASGLLAKLVKQTNR
jgi:anthranilate phosphoribosyltransferase